jgi:hypothetical protein
VSRDLGLLPDTVDELDRVRKACRAMVRRRAATSGGLTLVPLPGIDVAGDVALLMELIPAINRKFGLTPEQIEAARHHAQGDGVCDAEEGRRRPGRARGEQAPGAGGAEARSACGWRPSRC